MRLFMRLDGVQLFVSHYQIGINLAELTTFLRLGLLIVRDG